jgi:predicted small secreted protein
MCKTCFAGYQLDDNNVYVFMGLAIVRAFQTQPYQASLFFRMLYLNLFLRNELITVSNLNQSLWRLPLKMTIIGVKYSVSWKESLTMTKKFAILLLLVITTCVLSGCGNTFNGIGRDLESWGQTMQETF